MTLSVPGLLDQHAQKLRASGIAPTVWQARGYASILEQAELSAHGFKRTQLRVPGLLIPSFNPYGGDNPSVYRPDNPRQDSRGRDIKYETPAGSHGHLDLHPHHIDAIQNPAVRLYTCESIIKADAATSQGVCAIGFNGVWGWRTKNDEGGIVVSPDWERIPLRNREVVIPFDSDILTNTHVRTAAMRFRAFLLMRGSVPLIAYLPPGPNGEKVGLDDYLAQHDIGELAKLITDELKPGLDEDAPVTINGYNLTDLGNAERMADAHHNELRYVHPWKQWLVWDKRRWERDETGRVNRVSTKIVRSMYDEAERLQDDGEKKLLQRHAQKSESENRLTAIVNLTRNDERIATKPEQFDRHMWLLSCMNGTIDLQTGELRPHEPSDYITRLSPVEYDPTAFQTGCLWDQFIHLIMGDDEAMIEYLRRSAGYSLTGSTREGAIFYGLGETRTGKTTFLQALAMVMGDYAWKTAFETFLAGRRVGSPRDDIAALEGRRLVIASEVSHGQRFNESVMKELTGDDEVNARALYRAGTVFRPQLKLWLAANDMPHIRSDDSGMWSRMQIIGFNNPKAADRAHLPLKQAVRSIEQAGAQILAWMVSGALAWLEHDSLAVPESVTKAVEDQRLEFDPINEWLTEVIALGDELAARFGDLWDSYQEMYSGDKTSRILGRRGFKRALDERGFPTITNNGTVWYKGLRPRS